MIFRNWKKKQLFEWVQAGLAIHENAAKCLFCNNDLQQNRVDELNKFYSRKLIEIQKEIERLRGDLKVEKHKLKLSFPHENQVAKHLRNRFETAVTEFNKKTNAYGLELDILYEDLIIKESSYFSPVESISTLKVEETLLPELEVINRIIDEHNDYVADFEDNRSSALSKYLRHCVAEYLIAEQYVKKEKEFGLAITAKDRGKKMVRGILTNITELEAQLKDTVKGQEELNIYLRIFLGRDERA